MSSSAPSTPSLEGDAFPSAAARGTRRNVAHVSMVCGMWRMTALPRGRRGFRLRRGLLEQSNGEVASSRALLDLGNAVQCAEK